MGSTLLRALLEDLGRIGDRALVSTGQALSAPETPVWVESPAALATLSATVSSPEQVEAAATFVRDMVHTALHSALVAIDGGSAGAQAGRAELVDEDGTPLADNSHELYVEYLFEAGRVE